MPKRTGARAARLDDASIEALLDQIESAAVREVDPASVDSKALIDQLWAARVRARELITRRIVSGKCRSPESLIELLTMANGPQAVPFLKRIADAADLLPPLRLEARRRAGWPERGEAKRRREFISNLPDADLALAAFARSAVVGPLAEGERLEEVLKYLGVLPPDRCLTVLQHLDGEPTPGSIRLLAALLHLPDPALQRRALEVLVRWRPPGSEGALERFARITADADLRAQAEAAATALRALPESERPSESLLPVIQVWSSMIDGDGGQSLMLFRQWGDGVYLWVTFLVTDSWGVKDVYGMTHAPSEMFETLTDEMEEEGVSTITVDLPYLRGALARGIATNVATGQPLPPAFEVWEPWTHDAWPPPAGEAVAPVELDDAPYRNRANLLRRSMDLISHPWLDSWAFRPEELGPAFAQVPPPATERERGPAQAALAAITLERSRDRLRTALRGQACLFERSGDTRMRDLALAQSAWLADAADKELLKNAFLDEMMDRGIAMLSGGLPLEVFEDDLALEVLSGRPFLLPPLR